MGASGWEYVTPYEGTVEKSLEVLHARVFQELYGDDATYRNLEELWQDEEFMGEEGTHSILDIDRVVHTPAAPSSHNVADYGTLRPLAHERVVHHFGTDRPTPARFEEVLAQAQTAIGTPFDRPETLLDECRMRWTGVYVVLYTGDEPTHLGIFGFSGD
ncbi:hypothetical protein GCM10010503_48450 [Streptomyces lucensis JCM 4490]|uniref:Uncharacterized protein n=1 Tax=Streptomyces lucensis JCM 4490 TaxID=1306176 RepID=A0A918JC40_9ACTN|nr:hypothetical protein [Streptomyces lucensis]GGW65606.1 hypothetical protein GCM10010503_48450 [Streptomyces lucensis JCM 4490]